VTRGLAQLLLMLLAIAVQAVDGMTSNEVALVISRSISRAEQIEPLATIAVVDREGFVLGVWSLDPDITSTSARLKMLDAITKAGTASFLSSDQHAFTSRTAGFIVQQNFPPGVRNRSTGPLVGVNFSNMSFTDVNRFKNPHSGYVSNGLSGINGAPIADPVPPLAALSGLAGSPGGVPLFRDGKLIGGVGVAGKTIAPRRSFFSILADIQMRQTYDPDEDVALAGQIGFQPAAVFFGSHVFIDGIRVPYVRSKTQLGQVKDLGAVGAAVPPYEITNSPVVMYGTNIFGGQSCAIRAAIIDDPTPGDIRGQARLKSNDVAGILSLASARAKITRAGIRLPRGRSAQTFITVVNNPDRTNATPIILGTIQTPGATLFSWDVAIQKARTAVFFSDDTRAFSSRTVGFLAQRFYPPGIVNTAPGPFYGLQERFSLLPPRDILTNLMLSTQMFTNILNGVALEGNEALTTPNPSLNNGITIFPGGFPLYRQGVLIGAIGVSGDGIDQDDIIAAAGTAGFLPPPNIRADHMQFRGARLPYAKFPRNPDL
jgi:uncharacterized protein GlcG (DUF336 family)